MSFICEELDVAVDAPDACEDEKVRSWFNKNTGRNQDGTKAA
jgi:hypothetical protein